jgi:hypothetical protein
MEQNSPTPNLSPEIGKRQRQEVSLSFAVEKTSTAVAEMEHAPSYERQEALRQVSAVPTAVSSNVAQQPILPAPSAGAVAAARQDQTTNTNPATARDAGRIEKEWVDKAKQIVQMTKDNPYVQEKEVSKLQADYIKKRYGKDVKLPNE